MKSNKYFWFLLIALCFIWSGLLLGISFIEAPLKFTAPGITLKLGLGIGKVVFGMLSKIELTISFIIIVCLATVKAPLKIWFFFSLPVIILLIDTLLLMPILEARIDLILADSTPNPSNAHGLYIALEVVKLLGLISAGIICLEHLLIRK